MSSLIRLQVNFHVHSITTSKINTEEKQTLRIEARLHSLGLHTKNVGMFYKKKKWPGCEEKQQSTLALFLLICYPLYV